MMLELKKVSVETEKRSHICWPCYPPIEPYDLY